jgi:1-deoxy-D-xylulose-5-phosphate synthase
MLLETINSPQDLKNLTLEQLGQLAVQIRERIVGVVSRTGGHLASSLGAVELTIALHACLDAPRDKIIFDVGHQSYAHKILTGRNKNFDTLRQAAGISGFPSKEESAYDAFTTGHSSTAVSLALGLVCARDFLKATEYFKVVAVIGDGSLSGGLCFEGLNNAGHLKKDILVILNTNELSIAPNAGAISTYLNKIISLPIYNRFRASFDSFLESRVPRGKRLKQIANKLEEGLKGLFIPGILFEELGFRYFGPLDGHNLGVLLPTLKNIMSIKGPRLVHVVTKKGKGYTPAENEPIRFHSVASFDVASGKPLGAGELGAKTYTQVFGEKLADLAKIDKKIIAVTAAMPEGTGLDKFHDLYPERFFDVGIAEGHAVCFAAGLAAAGLRPVVAIYSTFLQRAYDQIVEEVALQKLPIILVLDRAGVVGEDGATHQGIFDIAFLRSMPNLAIMAPSNGAELEKMLEFALNLEQPVAIRYPKSVCPQAGLPASPLELGKSEVLKEGKDFTLIALGSMVEPAFKAAEILNKEGFSGNLINARFVKPLDSILFKKLCAKTPFIFTVEDGVLQAGFGSAVSEAINKEVVRIGLPDQFIPHAKRDALLERYGLSVKGIADCIRTTLQKNGQDNRK